MSVRLGILGGSGQLGTELARCAATQGYSVVAPPSDEVDITRESSVHAWVRDDKPSAIVNCAAYTAVDAAEDETDRAYLVNCEGAANVATAARATGTRLFHISTDYVFAGDAPEPYTEQDATGPISVYGASKLAGERRVIQSGADVLILRVSWVFGAAGRNFVKAILHRASHAGQLNVVDDQIGGPCSTRAISRALIHLIAANTHRAALYHLSSRPYVTWHGFATAIIDLALDKGLISRRPTIGAIPTSAYPARAKRPANSRMDDSRLKIDFGIVPSNWRAELDAVLDQIKANAAQ